jgi:4-amino-4-deoxy-L-arabinose transferase-like glycosyltransferase
MRSAVSLGILFLVTAAGLALRMYRLVWQGAWYDEAYSMTLANLSLHDMPAKLILEPGHPPLYSFVLHAVFQVAGFGDMQARLVSVVFGTLTILTTYALARYLYNASAGLMAAVLVAVSQLAVMYSQETRDYAMGLCLVSVALYFYVKAMREHNLSAWCVFVLTAILMVYTHYCAALTAACLFAHGWLFRRRFAIPASWFLWGAFAIGVSYIPWLTSGVVYTILHNPISKPMSQPPWFAAHWYSIIQDLNRFNNGAIRGPLDPAPLGSYAFGLLFVFPALLALRPLIDRGSGHAVETWSNRDSALLLTVVWLVPQLIMLVIAFWGIRFDVRYTLFCLVPYYALVAGGLASLPRSVLRWSWLAVIVLYSALALRAQYLDHYKEDYRGALQYLAGAERPGDCVIFMPLGELPLQWDVYERNKLPPHIIAPAALDAESGRCGRIWLVKFSRVFTASDQAQLKGVEQSLGAFFFNKTEERQYFWVDVALFAGPNVAADVDGEETAKKPQ